MNIEFDTKITAKVLYNYLLHHTYTSFSGLFGTVIGVLLLVVYFRQPSMGPLYLGMSIIIILFMPIEMWFRAKSQIKKNPSMAAQFHYVLNAEGVTVSQGEIVETQAWGNLYKAVSMLGNIVIYVTPQRAYIFPKDDLGEQRANVIEAISTHMEPRKVKIRY